LLEHAYFIKFIQKLLASPLMFVQSALQKKAFYRHSRAEANHRCVNSKEGKQIRGHLGNTYIQQQSYCYALSLEIKMSSTAIDNIDIRPTA